VQRLAGAVGRCARAGVCALGGAGAPAERSEAVDRPARQPAEPHPALARRLGAPGGGHLRDRAAVDLHTQTPREEVLKCRVAGLQIL